VLVAGLRGQVHRVICRPADGTVGQAPVARDALLHRRIVSQLDGGPQIRGQSRRPLPVIVQHWHFISFMVKFKMLILTLYYS